MEDKERIPDSGSTWKHPPLYYLNVWVPVSKRREIHLNQSIDRTSIYKWVTFFPEIDLYCVKCGLGNTEWKLITWTFGVWGSHLRLDERHIQEDKGRRREKMDMPELGKRHLQVLSVTYILSLEGLEVFLLEISPFRIASADSVPNFSLTYYFSLQTSCFPIRARGSTHPWN